MVHKISTQPPRPTTTPVPSGTSFHGCGAKSCRRFLGCLLVLAVVAVSLAGCVRLPAFKSADETARKRFSRAVHLNPDSPHAWFSLGKTQLEAGDYDEAAESFSRAAERNPDFVEAWIGKGQALELDGDLAKAHAAYAKALELRPDSLEARRHLAELVLDRGDLDAAEELWREALQLHPDAAIAHRGLGDVLYVRGHLREALLQWKAALALDPGLADLEPLVSDLETYLRLYPPSETPNPKAR